MLGGRERPSGMHACMQGGREHPSGVYACREGGSIHQVGMHMQGGMEHPSGEHACREGASIMSACIQRGGWSIHHVCMYMEGGREHPSGVHACREGTSTMCACIWMEGWSIHHPSEVHACREGGSIHHVCMYMEGGRERPSGEHAGREHMHAGHKPSAQQSWGGVGWGGAGGGGVGKGKGRSCGMVGSDGFGRLGWHGPGLSWVAWGGCRREQGCSTECAGWPAVHTFSMMSMGLCWSTLQPTETAVPRISLHEPARFLAQLLGRITRAISTTSSKVMLPVCLMFFSCCGGSGVETNVVPHAPLPHEAPYPTASSSSALSSAL